MCKTSVKAKQVSCKVCGFISVVCGKSTPDFQFFDSVPNKEID